MIMRSPNELALIAVNQRKQLGLSQSEVADRVGLKQKTISAFENKPESTKLGTVFLILSALHLELKTLSKDKDSDDITNWDQEW